jgi:hypothetical protein
MPAKDYIKYAEAVKLFMEAGLSETTFRRKVQEHPIARTMPEGRSRGALYSTLDVKAAIEQSRKEAASKDLLQHDTKQNLQDEEEGQTDWVKFADEPYAYVLDCELYGVENAVSPSITWTWWEKNPHACRILYNKNNRKDIWGLLSIIPMEEETIFRLLRGEMEEKEIAAEQVLKYEPGHIYSCYVAAASMRPDKRIYFGRLLHSVMQSWYEQYPEIQIRTLFAFALDGEEGEGIRLIRKLFFAPRYDIGENAWELRLDRYNPSPVVQQFQKSLKEKRTKELTAIPSFQEKSNGRIDPPAATFRLADSREDIAATVEVEGEIFNSKTDNDDFYVDLWYSWHQKNPEMFYVLEADNRIVGFVSLLPLDRQKIDRILRETESPSSITPEDIALFQSDTPLDLYIHVMGVRPGFSKNAKHTYGADLLRGLLGVFRDLGRRGVIIRTLFARTRMPDGLQLMEHMHFTEIVPPLAPGKRHFFLEIDQSNDLLIREYRQALQQHGTGVQ